MIGRWPAQPSAWPGRAGAGTGGPAMKPTPKPRACASASAKSRAGACSPETHRRRQRRDGAAQENAPSPAKNGLPELRHNQAAEQRRSLRPEQALAEIDQQNLALGEDPAQVKTPPGLPDDGPHFRAQQQRAQLVHNRRDGRRSLGLTPRLKATPERPQANRIATRGTTRRRKPASVSSSGKAASVMPGVRASVSSDAPRMSCVRGPQCAMYSEWNSPSS